MGVRGVKGVSVKGVKVKLRVKNEETTFGDRRESQWLRDNIVFILNGCKTLWPLLKAALLLSVSSFCEKRTLFLRVFVFNNILAKVE